MENQKRDATAKIKRLEEEHTSEVRSLKEAAREKEIRQREHQEQMREDFKNIISEMQTKHDKENRRREDRFAQEIRQKIDSHAQAEQRLRD